MGKGDGITIEGRDVSAKEPLQSPDMAGRQPTLQKDFGQWNGLGSPINMEQRSAFMGCNQDRFHLPHTLRPSK
jgi:hypothetical protein